MSLFFFHFITESERDEDHIGVELASVEVAYLEAVRAARGMGSELLTAGIDAGRCSFEITDAQGELLFVLDFAELLKREPRTPSANHHTFQLASAITDTHHRVAAAKRELNFSMTQARSSIAESLELIARLSRFERGRIAAVSEPGVT